MIDVARRQRLRETSVLLETATSRISQNESDQTVDVKLAIMARNLVAVYEINRESAAALVKAIQRQDLDAESFRWLLRLLGPAMLKAKHKQDEVEHVLKVVAKSWGQQQSRAIARTR